jgi:hypothetical protein
MNPAWFHSRRLRYVSLDFPEEGSHSAAPNLHPSDFCRPFRLKPSLCSCLPLAWITEESHFSRQERATSPGRESHFFRQRATSPGRESHFSRQERATSPGGESHFSRQERATSPSGESHFSRQIEPLLPAEFADNGSP